MNKRLIFLKVLAFSSFFILSLSFGYALLSQNLNVTSTVTSESWPKDYQVDPIPSNPPYGENGTYHYSLTLSLTNVTDEMARSWDMVIKVPKTATITDNDAGKFYNCLYKLYTIESSTNYNLLKLFGISGQNAFLTAGQTLNNIGLGFTLPIQNYSLDPQMVSANFYNEVDKKNPNYLNTIVPCTLTAGSGWTSNNLTYKIYDLSFTNTSSYTFYEWEIRITSNIDANQIVFNTYNNAYSSVYDGKASFYNVNWSGNVRAGGSVSLSFQISSPQSNVSLTSAECIGKSLILN